VSILIRIADFQLKYGKHRSSTKLFIYDYYKQFAFPLITQHGKQGAIKKSAI
jgi:hypothetical protein